VHQHTDLYKLIKKYRKQQCTPAEVAFLFQWLDKMGQDISPEEAATLQTIREAMKREVWAQQQQMIGADAPSQKTPLFKLRGWQAAAILTGLGIGLYFLLRPDAPPAKIATNIPDKMPPVVSRDSVIINHTNQQQRHLLADGSAITMTPHTTLQLKTPWPQQGREVRLNGEALFDVAKDAQHPFSVRTRRFSTAVLGTVFRINAYDSATVSRVQLLSGSIAVKSEQQTLVMVPGNDFTFNSHMQQIPAAKTTTGTTVADEGAVIFQDSTFHFNNTPLLTVLHTLGTQYQATIHFAPTLKLSKRKYTGNIKITRPLEEVLVMLTSLNDLRVDSTAAGYLIRAN
jgi:transmembrane sensor